MWRISLSMFPVKALLLAFAFSLICCDARSAPQTQGPVLVVQPTSEVRTVAGTGTEGFSGDLGPASSAALAGPSQIAGDANGNLYFADQNNNRIRKIDSNGTITTVAGSTFQGFAGDGHAATSAMLNRPGGVALDALGNLYIADTGNHRVRMISHGIITTVAGTGSPSFCGDGSAATSACLFSPRALAFDASGNLYIADMANQRVRVISAGIISTFAGTGVQGDSGDGGPAVAAKLNLPSGISIDSGGTVYIADTGNNRIRTVFAGIISAFAGSGAEGLSGDGGNATASTMDFPTSARLDPLGNVLIADANNSVLRRVLNGVITTEAGTDLEGPAGGTVTPLAAVFNKPIDVFPQATGFYVTDFDNRLIRRVDYSALDFGTLSAGATSAVKPITLSDSGTTPVTISTFQLSGSAFQIASGGNCPHTLPFTIQPGTSCTVNIQFAPPAVGTYAQLAIFIDNAPGSPHWVALAGAAITNTTTLQIAAQPASSTYGNMLTVTASLHVATSTGAPQPAGQITFLDGVTPVSTQSLVFDEAQISPVLLPAGPHTFTATYSGDAAYAPSSAATIVEIAKATPTISLTSAPSPIVSGMPLTLSAKVVPLAGIPTGSVTFSDASTTLGSVTLPSTGDVSLNVATLSSGPHSILATYSGDTNFNAVTSSPVTSQGASFLLSSVVKNSAGFTDTIEVDLTPINNFNGTVTLSCPNLPANASCAFLPAQLTANGGKLSSTLTLRTSVNCASQGGGLRYNLLLPFWLLILTGLRKHRLRRVFLACVIVIAVNGCAGLHTLCTVAAGQYALTITGTSTVGTVVLTDTTTVHVTVTSSGAVASN